MLTTNINTIINELKNNNVVSIPTDTVYGLSCGINREAITEIINLKQRDSSKGFIIISHCEEHLLKYIDTSLLNNEQITKIKTPQAKPTTWIVPAINDIQWLTGGKQTVAVRLAQTKTIKQICNSLGDAIISTSANISGKEFINDPTSINNIFKDLLILKTCVSEAKPSNIINLMTNEKIR